MVQKEISKWKVMFCLKHWKVFHLKGRVEAKQLPFFSFQSAWWLFPWPVLRSGTGAGPIFICVTGVLKLATFWSEEGTVWWNHLPHKKFLYHHNCFIYYLLNIICRQAWSQGHPCSPADAYRGLFGHRTASDDRQCTKRLGKSSPSRVRYIVTFRSGWQPW